MLSYSHRMAKSVARTVAAGASANAASVIDPASAIAIANQEGGRSRSWATAPLPPSVLRRHRERCLRGVSRDVS